MSTVTPKLLNCLKIDFLPSSLTCRDQEVRAVTIALQNSLANNGGGEGHVLYLYGQPGTGKSATVKSVVKNLQRVRRDVKFHEINVLSLSTPASIFPALCAEMTGQKRSIAGSFDMLEKVFRRGNDSYHHVVLLDEFDNVMIHRGKNEGLNSRLFSLFDWPTLQKANLTLICVANTLCLPQHLMPRCFSRLGFGHINFKTYDHDELLAIIEARFREAETSTNAYFHPAAIQMLCRKVASLSGDVRMAFSVCRQLLEGYTRKILINDVTTVVAKLFASATSEFAQSLPFHTQILLLCLAQLHMSRRRPDETLGYAIAAPQLLEVYSNRLNLINAEMHDSIGEDSSISFCAALDELVDAGAIQNASFLQVQCIEGVTRRKRMLVPQRCDPSVQEGWGQTAISLMLSPAEIIHGINKGNLSKKISCIKNICTTLEAI